MGEHADDAVKRLHDRHFPKLQVWYANERRWRWRPSATGDASRSRITGEAVTAAAVEQTYQGKTYAHARTEERHDGAAPE